MNTFHFSSVRVRIAIALLGILSICGFRTPFGVGSALGGDTHPSADEVMQNIHENLAEMSQAVGGLSPEQQSKLDTLEKDLAAKIKSDPSMPESPSFRGEVIGKFSEILTPEQKDKFDKLMMASRRRAQGVQTAARLKQIALGAMMFANDHNGNLPPGLGALLAESLAPDTFLAGGSKTQVPKDFATLDPKKQAAWVDENSDFVFLGEGKPLNKLPATAVLAYVKNGSGEQYFVFADGSVQNFNAEQSAKIIAELKAGTNPPPSLPK